ncbi:hypothetical protein A616_17215 [Brevibacillus brevis X23]|nr:hypothetical protein A616_17215 [Brevibacillus brevis X23]
MWNTMQALGKDLDQLILSEIADLLGQDVPVENGHEEEGWMVKKWQDKSLSEIMIDTLTSANDFYMDEILSDNDILKINKLIIALRRPE